MSKADQDFDGLLAIEVRRRQARVDGCRARVPADVQQPGRPEQLVLPRPAGRAPAAPEACDWCAMLLRQYLKYCERKGFKTEVMEESEGDVAGIKSATIKIEERLRVRPCCAPRPACIGWCERARSTPPAAGTPRSPASSSTPEVDDSIEIDINPADVDTFRASMPAASTSTRPTRRCAWTHIPTNIVVQCQNDRSHLRNRDEAWRMLRSRLYEARDAYSHGGTAEAGRLEDRCGLGPPDPQLRPRPEPDQGSAYQRRKKKQKTNAGREISTPSSRRA